jgi:hypothetical protein
MEIYYNWEFAFNFIQTVLLSWILIELKNKRKW